MVWAVKLPKLLFVILVSSMFLTDCTYLHYSRKQADYRQKFQENHLRADSKHLLEANHFFIIGELVGWGAEPGTGAMAVAALDRENPGQMVDITHFVRVDSYFGLHLPQGSYSLVVLEDANGDGIYDSREMVAEKSFEVDATRFPTFVGEVKLHQSAKTAFQLEGSFSLPALAHSSKEVSSLFYPKGAIKSLDDPVFHQKQARMGMYAPAAFIEKAPLMFYALEEDLPYKTPIIFVHGIGGSPVEFKTIIGRLDRTRYKPWFFYYPSGSDLDKTAKLFYRIFLSGNVIKKSKYMPLMIVAHSMGGLLVRRACNYYQNKKSENQVDLFVSIATPFQGHPKAAKGIRRAPMVLPSWRDLDPEGVFIEKLYQTPLPSFMDHHLITASLPQSSGAGSAGDGVVPLASQQFQAAVSQAQQSHHFQASHVGILSHEPLLEMLLDLFDQVPRTIPDSHFPFFNAGGFEVNLPPEFTAYERYVIHHMGHYLQALDQGKLEPVLKPEHHFVKVMQGKAKASSPMEIAWLKFKKGGFSREQP